MSQDVFHVSIDTTINCSNFLEEGRVQDGSIERACAHVFHWTQKSTIIFRVIPTEGDLETGWIEPLQTGKTLG